MWKPGQLINVKGYFYLTLCLNRFEIAFETTMVCRITKRPMFNVGYHREIFPLLKSNNFLSLEHAYVKYWSWNPKTGGYVPFEINANSKIGHFVIGNLVDLSSEGYLKPIVEQFSPYYASLLNCSIVAKCGKQDNA